MTTVRRGGFLPHALIVSDDPGLSSFLGEGLLMSGFWTSVVASALQALEVFRLRSFDIVIIDGELAGLGARELLKRFHGLDDGGSTIARTDVPIIVISSIADDSARDELIANGAAAVFTAPIELADVAMQLQDIVHEWREVHPDRPWADAAGLSGLVNGSKA